jgi:hypothetical protein
MSKTKSAILAKPHKQRKVMQKQVNRRFAQIDAKISIEKRTNDPYGLRDAFKQRQLYGKIGCATELEK